MGKYILDFYCPYRKISIELDGEGHNDPAQMEHDKIREAFLLSVGIVTLRFENRLVFEQPEEVLSAIARYLV